MKPNEKRIIAGNNGRKMQVLFKRNTEGDMDLDASQHDQPSAFLSVKHQQENRFCANACVSKHDKGDPSHLLPLLERTSKRIASTSNHEGATNKEVNRDKIQTED